MTKRLVTLMAVLLAAAIAVPALAAPASTHSTLLAALSGAEEVGGGDPDAVGAAFVQPQRGRTLCFRLVARNAGDAVAAHIHRGAPGVNGPIVVPLFDDPTGNGEFRRRQRCVRAPSAGLARRIQRSPGRFYVNLHSTAFPNGAIRGQLSR